MLSVKDNLSVLRVHCVSISSRRFTPHVDGVTGTKLRTHTQRIQDFFNVVAQSYNSLRSHVASTAMLPFRSNVDLLFIKLSQTL